MNKIFNWIFGSFFRTLGRVLVYIFLGVLLCYLFKDLKLPNLFTILDVNALQVAGVEYSMPAEVALYNNTGLNSSTQVNISNRIISNTGVSDYYGEVSTTSSGYGASWCMSSPVTFLNGYIYSVQIVLMNANDTSYNIVSNDNYDMLRLGYSLSDAITHSNTTSINYFGAMKDSNGIYSGDYLITNRGYVLTYMFTSKLNSQYICLPFRTTTNQTQLEQHFYGMKVDIIGQSNLVTNDSLNSSISNSGLASASSVAQVQASINQVQSDINNGTNNIINNQNANSQAEIDNANANTDKTIDSQKVCQQIDKNNIEIDNKFLKNNGTEGIDNNFGITGYINIYNSDVEINEIFNSTYNVYNVCYYNVNKTLISCQNLANLANLTIPNSTYYMRSSIIKSQNRPTYEICKNGNQAVGDSINDMNSSIINSDSSQATNDASSFFNGFNTDTHGLTGIITAPLNAIQSLSSKQCSPLVLPLPFVNQDLTLPCMRDIYTQYFGDFMTLYDIITLGIISYWVMVRIFSLVKDFKNPEHDEIEVLDL